jgi:hypothetical protein
MTTMNEIELQARKFADAHERLSVLVDELNAGLERHKRALLPRIKRALASAAEQQTTLKALVTEAPELFIKPRTAVAHGIKFGYRKAAGKVEFEDADQVVALIKRKLPELADVLIITTEKPSKTGLEQLTVAQLKAVACSAADTSDVVVVQPVDSDVDKLVKALLKDYTDEAVEA